MKISVTICLIACLVLMWAGPATAIEKSKKDKTSVQDNTATIKKQNPVDSERAVTDRTKKPENSRKSYDNFVDRNNNGIDDRAEKSSASKKPKQKSASRRPVKKDPKR